MELNQYDIIIIGAGAAGLMAAMELALAGKKTAVVEAKDGIGGRARSLHLADFEKPVQIGAEFIHGKLELTRLLLQKTGASYYEVNGELWQKKEGKWQEQNDFVEDFRRLNKKLESLQQDISVQEFLDQHLSGPQFEKTRFSLKNYVEGYYAANTERASSLALREELNNADEEQYRIDGGYSKLFDYLYSQCIEKGVQFYFSHPVKQIAWEKNSVIVSAHQQAFRSQKVLITVPVGVLQSRGILFSPGLAAHENAVQQLGYGGVIKTILQFKEPFWTHPEMTRGKDLAKMGFIFSEAIIPTWWSSYPKTSPVLTGWIAGPHTEKLKDLTAEQILDKALQSLAEIFDLQKDFFRQQLLAWHVANWINDPYSCGGYSYEVVNGKEAKKILRQPVDSTIYFAGEGLFEGLEIGTVNAALVMGRETAHEMIAAF